MQTIELSEVSTACTNTCVTMTIAEYSDVISTVVDNTIHVVVIVITSVTITVVVIVCMGVSVPVITISTDVGVTHMRAAF